MKDAEQPEDERDTHAARHQSRFGLLWAVFVFQAKLIVDGLRDVVLVPISLVAALLGLVAGGNEPDRYFRKVLQFGRSTEVFINLFGHRMHGSTADALIEPIKKKVVDESQQLPWVQKAEKSINKTLDKVNERVESAVSQRENKD